MEIRDDFIVPHLTSPPLTIPDRVARPSVERFEVKADITPILENNKRHKTEIMKRKDEVPEKVVSKVNCLFHYLILIKNMKQYYTYEKKSILK